MRSGWKHMVVGVVLGLGMTGGAQADYSRRNPIVEAVEKTDAGVITLKVTRRSEWARKQIMGTGVIVDERGYAITNAHVVERAEKVVVQLHDESTVEAKVHVEDPRHDLAILKLPARAKGYKPLTFAPGSDLKRGETVIAIGNPYGFAGSVCTGLISGLKRRIVMPSGEPLTNLIQHTACINPGNSGGPLLNINGELIGINVALRDGAQAISFALNADSVQAVLSKHLSAARVSRVRHGLTCKELVGGKGPDRQKVVVDEVAARSAAAKAGLKKGDVLVQVGQRPVSNRFDVERALWGYKAGDTVSTAVLRDGKITQVSLTLTSTAPARVASGPR
jgi:serine protease Do